MTYENTIEHRDTARVAWATNALQAVQRALKNWRGRQAISCSLGTLPDHMLRDIGLTANDVESALNVSSLSTETDRLGEIAKTQSKNW
ncbi:DUF1127 domain-containing protein [Marimonas sp. MJW-29]|uniref:DUF1127 domain-containing protein n=1 Tax=Sulfitobacter sediminis TaxID=3234186 RepID=A0ABV3RUF5_9RHOB